MNATTKLRSITVVLGAMLVLPISCSEQEDEDWDEGWPYKPPDTSEEDTGPFEDEIWVGQPCEPVTEDGQADPCIEISGGNQDAFCLAWEGAPGGICTRECEPVTMDGCEGEGVVCKDISLLTAPVSDDKEGYGVCLEECVVDTSGNECKADYIACNPKAWSFESMFATCLLPKCVTDADCPVPVGTLCYEDADCDATAGEHCSGGICVFDGECNPQSGLCEWNGDPDAEIGDPCETTRDCPDDCECKTPSVDEHGKAVAANGYCLKRGCMAANEWAPNGSGSSAPGAKERFGCGVVGTCYAGFYGGGACMRRCGPSHEQAAFKCRQSTWGEDVGDVNGDYDCYDPTALGFCFPINGCTEMYPAADAPLCAWVANSFLVKCNSPDYDGMTSSTCSQYFGDSFDLDMTCRNAATGEPDEDGYCLDETASGPSEKWGEPGGPRPPMESCQGGLLDPFTGLCWQDPPDETAINWYEAGGTAEPEHNPGGAVDYCGDLELGGSADWRLPDIDELISLLRGCVDGEVTGDLTASCCPMNDPDCLDEQSCWEEQSCGGCAPQSGPGEAGSYQDESLSGAGWLWSASSSELSGLAWGVDFDSAVVGKGDKAQAYRTRCVRQVL